MNARRISGGATGWCFLVILGILLLVGAVDMSANCMTSPLDSGLLEDCSHRQFSTISAAHLIRKNVVKLLLNDNSISEINADDFAGFGDLISLDLLNNYIRSINKLAFVQTPKLEQLILSSNHFPGLPDEALRPLTYLKELYLDHAVADYVTLKPLGDGFSHLAHLNTLDLSQLSFPNISSDFFTNLEKTHLELFTLEAIKIEPNGIIDRDAFRGFKHLKCLNMRKIERFDESRLHNVLVGLNGSTLKRLILQLGTLSSHSFSGFTDNVLEELVLSYSNIGSIGAGTFANLKRLLLLKLDNCPLRHVDQTTFWGLTNLQVLDLSYNSLISYNLSGNNLPNLQVLDISFNSDLKTMESMSLSGLKKLQVLKAYNLVTDTIQNCAFCGLSNLETILLNFTKINGVDPFAFSGLYKVNYADFTWVTGWSFLNQSSFQDMSSLETLILNRINFQHISKHSFTPLRTTLKSLSIEGSDLSSDDGLFQSLETLEMLDIEDTRIVITSTTFSGTYSLKKLMLSSNTRVNRIPPAVMSLPNLEYLEIKDCNISIISSKKEIDFLQSPQLKGFAGSSNPYHCSCELESFVRWLNGSGQSKVTDDLLLYQCYQSSDLVKDYLHNLLYCDPTNNLALFISVPCGILVLLSVQAFIIYRCRWAIKWQWYKFRLNHYKILDDEEEHNQHIEFDSFVSYSNKDYKFVEQYLIPELEEPRDGSDRFKLAVDYRQFLPGETLSDAIIRHINISKRTLLLLSNNFIDSHWTLFEYHMAQSKLCEKRDIVVVVVLECIRHRMDDLPVSLQRLLRTRPANYLEWTQNEEGQKFFWKKLRKAIGKPTLVRPPDI